MSDQIPDERYILKQDLWRKIDKSWEQTNGLAKEIYARIEQVKNELKAYYEKLVLSYQDYKQILSNENANNLVQLKKELEQAHSAEKESLIIKNVGTIESLKTHLLVEFSKLFDELKTDSLKTKTSITNLESATNRIVGNIFSRFENIEKNVSDIADQNKEDIEKRLSEFKLVHLAIQSEYNKSLESADKISGEIVKKNEAYILELKKELTGKLEAEVDKMNESKYVLFNNLKREIENVRSEFNYNAINKTLSDCVVRINGLEQSVNDEIASRMKLGTDTKDLVRSVKHELLDYYNVLIRLFNEFKDKLSTDNTIGSARNYRELEALVIKKLDDVSKDYSEKFQLTEKNIYMNADKLGQVLENEFKKRFDDLLSIIRNLESHYGTEISGAKKAINDFQLEMKDKFIAMSNKFDHIIDKFKLISTSISK